MDTVLLLFPADPLRPRRPDPHFAPEADAARAAGAPVALIDHDLLAAGGDPARAVAAVRTPGWAVYRGWMLSSDRYAALTEALAARDVHLWTTPERYRRAHELPGWYAALAAVTPASAWTAGSDRAAFDEARRALGPGPAVLRDHVKSAKHHWHEAAFVPDLADGAAAWRVATRLRELRQDDFAGGFVLRRFEPFTGAEVRTWWIGGRCVLAGAHPDTPEQPPEGGPDLSLPAAAVAALDLPFVTVDLARRTDGRWRVIELGDGQVSDRPASLDPAALIEALLAAAPTPASR
ncbi:ATP-grasp domain-containing protein [Micromonospora sp. NPDC048930]|uniref:ATP-grasp domain-containing protein n=1 Tax=Micromonospora sp. NPDC048930 TaxID=3364261 RepID=UPI00371A2D8D